ncbi:MAG: hypothetical protein ACJA2M_000298 [Polaribacter sp.]|jgi:hypothetical protein
MGITIILGLAIWYLIGMYSFYYWWTKDNDINTDPELLCLWMATGLLGVLNWFVGMSIHNGEPIKGKYRTLFKKRE